MVISFSSSTIALSVHRLHYDDPGAKTDEGRLDIARTPAKSRTRWTYATIGLISLGSIVLVLGRLGPAGPSIDKGNLLIDTVRQGLMIRDVRGSGTLVPEQVRWITAVTAGRVEEVLVQPGAVVSDSTVLMVLTNPDVQIQTLNAERQLTSAEADLVTLRTNLESQRLNQVGILATQLAQFRAATRKGIADSELARRGLISDQELKASQDQVEESTARLRVEQQRLDLISSTIQSQLDVQQRQVERLRSIAVFQRDQERSMTVRAGAKGVVQELPLQMGQWANPGATLAKVVQAGHLKAVLRIPETQIPDVSIGQVAIVDTRNGIARGTVSHIDPAPVGGAVSVDVSLTLPLPAGARPDLSVDGSIEIERLDNVLYTGRPAYGQANSRIGMFRLDHAGRTASRIDVQLGRVSASNVEITKGLQPGDVIILSDMTQWGEVAKVRLH